MLLIDATKNCLVHTSTSARYLALSYFRGVSTMFETTSEDYTLLQQPGALCRVTPLLDVVVRDIIECTCWLGEQYVWIDALCITQDDDRAPLSYCSETLGLEGPLAAECSSVQANAHPDPVPIFECMGSRLPNQASHCAQSMPSPLEVSSQ